VAQRLATNPASGLASAEAARRLERYGANALEVSGTISWYAILGRQFADFLILILLVATAFALAIGDVADAVTILAIVILNGLLGFAQEWKAERGIEALQQMLEPRCNVLRDNEVRTIDAHELVPGDVVVLQLGDRVPADIRLVQALNLRTDESVLTGESVPVEKGTDPVSVDAPLAERSAIAWMGTVITNGRARGIVTATGMETEFGRIARLTESVRRELTPLQQRLAVLGKQLGVFSVTIGSLVGLAGWLLGRPLADMFLTGVALAVAAVPEGLPAVVTITLALGVRAMVAHKALLRRLQAAETLGAATVVCTDKTGTLTKNEMTVTHIWLPSGELHVGGTGYEPVGEFEQQDSRIDPGSHADLLELLETGLSCSHARVVADERGWHAIGEPTEAALVVAARKAGLRSDPQAQTVAEFSFNSNRKRMTVISRGPRGLTAHVKGAPEAILDRSSRMRCGKGEKNLNAADRKRVTQAYQTLAEQGLRTLGLAQRDLPEGLTLDEEHVECDLTLLGMVGIIDPPHVEVPEAVRVARAAGIRIMMITGDAAPTAVATGRAVGLFPQRVISGGELDAMDEAELRKAFHEDVIFARTTPEHKLRIVQVLQQMGHVVGMTGDGVNDAPALRQAEIGIAMGLRGTDVARGAADMVLTDDNFASIIGAVREGRRQYDNIQKFVRYLLSSNTAEVLAIFVNIVTAGPLILLPVQILWMNLVTDGLTAVALGMEPAEKGIMKRRPRKVDEPILNRKGVFVMLALASYMAAATLWLFNHYLTPGTADALLHAQTVAFTGLIALEKMNVLNFRTLREPTAMVGFFSNPWLLLAWCLALGLQLCAVYVPFLQEALHTVALDWYDWGLIAAVALPVHLVTETVKWWKWKRAGRRRNSI
jgi:P-type Ca2+ transporter type 2C